ncbi:MAG: PAS domain S-box protein [Chitinophagales bacterium]|nr:PAS domain S-box protein [Chitinophagales bacterium]
MTAEHNNDVMLASLFAYATEGIILANRAGEIVLANPFAEKMFGFTQQEMIGQPIEILLPDNVREKHVQHRDAFHKNPVNRSMGAGRDLYAKRKDGSVFPVEVSLSHYTMNGEVFVIAFIIDITVRKHNEEIQRMQREELQRVSDEIRKLNIGLEQKVEDRTMMLRETLAQLERSKADLEHALEKEKELSDLKSRFVSTVSHEFRTPLAAVLSSASLLAKYTKEEDQEKRERHIQRIKESVKSLSDLLEDLLSLGKLEEGLIKANPQPFACKEFMHDFVNEIQGLAKAEQKILLHHTGGDEVVTDKRLLRNILLNLVSNAIKFSPEKSDINISCSNNGNNLTLIVKDSGIGISEEDKQHLFERFFRARNAQNIQGTGLGLHIVSKYIELLNGKIELQSEINNGTTFTITIPNQPNSVKT